MRAVQFNEFGGPEVLRVVTVAKPEAGPGQVRIKVRAASLNPADAKLRSGRFGMIDLPATPGYDAAGVVDQVGAGVTEVSIGAEVFGLGQATYAEYAILNSYLIKPDQLGFNEAAAAGTAGETAVRALDLLGVGQGSTVLIDGASGGVGLFAVQLAIARGAQVIGTASPRNHALLSELGAQPISYGPHLGERVARAAPTGVDAVFDVAGKTDVDELIALAPVPSQVVSIANFAAASAGARVSTGDEGDPVAALGQVSDLARRGLLRVLIQQVFGLDEAIAAHRLIETGHVRGKLIMKPDGVG